MRFFLKWSCLVSSCLLLLALRPSACSPKKHPRPSSSTRADICGLTSYSDTGTVLKEYGPTSHDEIALPRTSPAHRATSCSTTASPATGSNLGRSGCVSCLVEGHRASHRIPQSQQHRRHYAHEYPTAGRSPKFPRYCTPRESGRRDSELRAATPGRNGGVAGNKCYRLEGTTSDVYAQTGKKVDVRNVTVWIDSTNYLIRKILEEAPAAPGTLNRTTTTFKPHANPKINNDSFQFAPPK